jgi:hypothetical protein
MGGLYHEAFVAEQVAFTQLAQPDRHFLSPHRSAIAEIMRQSCGSFITG